MNNNAGALTGKRILVVDDDEISRLVAMEILEGLGAEVVTATGPAEALRLVSANAFDLILLDLHMPEMCGTELAAALEKLDESLRENIVFLTARNTDDDVKTSEAAESPPILTKPLDPRLILDCFRDISPRTDWGPAQTNPSMTIDGIDFSAGIRNFMGQEHAFLSTLGMFPEYGRNFIEEYERHLLTENRKECWRLAHSLKGSSAMIGATGINALARNLESICGSSDDFDIVRSAFKEIREKILALCDMIAERNLQTHSLE